MYGRPFDRTSLRAGIFAGSVRRAFDGPRYRQEASATGLDVAPIVEAGYHATYVRGLPLKRGTPASERPKLEAC
jgi:hypothetical protein